MNFIPNLYLKISLILIGVAALGAYPLYLAFNQFKPFLALSSPIFKLKNLQKDGPFAQNINNQLSQEHTLHINNIMTAFGITEQDAQQMRSKIESIKANDNLLGKKSSTQASSAPPLIKTAIKIMEKHGINPDKVIIQTVDKPNSACDISAGQAFSKNKVQHFLQINVPVLEQKPTDVQEALLSHEMQHLLNYDSIEQFFIDTLLKQYEIAPEVYSRHFAYTEYCKFIEFRADLLASYKDEATAQGLKKAFEIHIEKYPNALVSLSHPTSQARLAAMNQLITHLNVQPVTA